MIESNHLRFVDTHCHLEQEVFDKNRDEIILNALNQGILCICSAITKDTWSKCITIAKTNASVYASIGLDPIQANYISQAIEFIHNNTENIIAIGEVGLDHYRERDHLQRNLQESAFREFIALSKKLKIPIQVHSRSAGKKSIDVLEETEASLVHLHAFDGKASYAGVASRDLDYYFSIPASVVRSPQKQKLVKAVALERLLLETDSPVLGAEKGERNEPANITIALKEVATILRREEDEIREIILENTLRLYNRINFL